MVGEKKTPRLVPSPRKAGARGQGESHETTLLHGWRLTAFETLLASLFCLLATFFSLADGFR